MGRLLTDLARSATTDALTDLPNLPETTRRLDDLLQQHGRVVLAAVTVLSFKEVNDTLGRGPRRRAAPRGRRGACARPARTPSWDGSGAPGSRWPCLRSAVARDPEHFGLTLRSRVEGTAQVGAVGTHVRLSVGAGAGA